MKYLQITIMAVASYFYFESLGYTWFGYTYFESLGYTFTLSL